MKEFKSAGQAQRFLSAAHDQINDLFHLRRDHATFRHRAAGTRTFRWGRKGRPYNTNRLPTLPVHVNPAVSVKQVDGEGRSVIKACSRGSAGAHGGPEQ